MLSDVGRDVRYAFRTLVRTPVLTLAIVLTVGLGIGANTLIFSAIDAVLLRDLPVSDAERLVDVYTSSGNNPYGDSSYPDYFDLRDSGVFESLAAYAHVPMALDLHGRTEPLAGELVSGNYFEVLGVDPVVGRVFTPDEDRIGSPVRVAVISHGLWQRAFQASAAIIGRTIRLNGNAYTVVGVAPQRFAGPMVGMVTDVWLPSALQPEVDPPSAAVQRARGHARTFDVRRSRGLNMVGRLPRGASIAQTRSGADVVGRRLQADHPDTNRNRTFTLAPLGEGRGLRVTSRPVLQLLAGAVAFVLIVACANVASLLLARAVSRRREVAVRVAIGASRRRLIRQWLTESVLLALLGSIAACLIAWWGTPLLHRFVIPQSIDLSLSPRVLGFTLLAAVGSGLIFGLAPVLQTLRDDVLPALREEGGAIRTAPRASTVRGAFVILQVALSLVLLVGAGLFVRTLENAYSVDLGYEVDQTLVASLNLGVRGYSPEAGLEAYEQILSRLETVPGVVAAAAARMMVLTGGARSTAVSIDGFPIEPDKRNALGVRQNTVSDRYFDAMNIPIRRGRSFARSDASSTPRVAIASQSLAERLWPGEDPIGKGLRDESNREHTVVGVVPDTVYTSTLERNPRPTFYVPLAQNYESAVALHVRTTGDPTALLPAIREALRQVDSRLVLERPQLLRDVLDQSLSRQRMLATLVSGFGALALVLAVLGVYGVMAHSTTQRTAEIGIRLALGARPSAVVTSLMAQGLGLLAAGAAMGLIGAVLCTRLIAAQLFEVQPTDPLTFATMTAVLWISGLTACFIPARRAAGIDPSVALRRQL